MKCFSDQKDAAKWDEYFKLAFTCTFSVERAASIADEMLREFNSRVVIKPVTSELHS